MTDPTSPVTVYGAAHVVTMNPSNPSGRYVAVRDGLILGVGHDLSEFDYWGPHVLDERFADLVLVPGFVEAHSHSQEGFFAGLPYVGYFDRPLPDGGTAPGTTTIEGVVARLVEIERAMTDPDAALLAWGFDPIYFTGTRFNRSHLDQVSTTRQVFVLHASGHLATVNSALLAAQGVTAATQTEGVAKDGQGEPTGELQETAMLLAGPVADRVVNAAGAESTWWDFGRAALVGGLTTVTDLGVDILGQPDLRTLIAKVVNDPAFPARVVTYALPAAFGQAWDPAQVAEAFHALRSQQTDRWRLGGIKLVADGSIQGWTAVLNPPGYRDGSPGIWTVSPEEMLRSVPVFHAAGINVHCHANGSAVIDAFCDAVDTALRQVAWLDHRHTVQHAQLASDAQLRRMANLGMAANFFINHIPYWGDQHYELTVGPERASRMEPCASAIREGVRFSLHCDCNVTPLGALQLMWAAVNRQTASGRVLGPQERISAYDALKAVTLDAAYQLHLDHQIGSLETGKLADFTVLAANPLEVDPMAIREIPVRGTVVGGTVYETPGQR